MAKFKNNESSKSYAESLLKIAEKDDQKTARKK